MGLNPRPFNHGANALPSELLDLGALILILAIKGRYSFKQVQRLKDLFQIYQKNLSIQRDRLQMWNEQCNYLPWLSNLQKELKLLLVQRIRKKWEFQTKLNKKIHLVQILYYYSIIIMLTLESRCLPVLEWGVLHLRTLSNR